MVIEPLHTPRPLVEPLDFSSSPLLGGGPLTTLTSLQEHRRQKRPFAFTWISTKFHTFFAWLKRLIGRKKPEKQKLFFKIGEKKEGGATYRLVLGGNSTDNTIELGEKTSFLKEVAFSNPECFDSLSQMVKQIMKEEKIDGVLTQNLTHAKALWKGGLHTTFVLPMHLPARSAFDQVMHKILKEAMQKRQQLRPEERKALETIEQGLVSSVISDAFTSGENVDLFYEKAILELQGVFPKIDLEKAALCLEEKAEGATLKASIAQFKELIPYAVETGRIALGIDIPLAEAFVLREALSIPFERTLAHLSQPIKFTKEKKPCA